MELATQPDLLQLAKITRDLADQGAKLADAVLDLTARVEHDIRALEGRLAQVEEQSRLDQQALRQMREQYDDALRSRRREERTF